MGTTRCTLGRERGLSGVIRASRTVGGRLQQVQCTTWMLQGREELRTDASASWVADSQADSYILALFFSFLQRYGPQIHASYLSFLLHRQEC